MTSQDRDTYINSLAAMSGVAAIDELEEEGEISASEAGRMLAAKGFSDNFIQARGFTPPPREFIAPDEFAGASVTGFRGETINYENIDYDLATESSSLNPIEWSREQLKKIGDSIIASINSTFSSITGQLTRISRELAGSVSGVVGGWIDKISGFFTSVITGTLNTVKGFVSSIQEGYQTVLNISKNIAESVKGWFVGIKDAIADAVKTSYQTLKNIFSDLLGATVGKIQELYNSFRDFSIRLQETFRENFRTALNVFKSGLEGIGGAVLSGMKYLVDELIQTIAYVVNDLNNLLGVSTEAIAESVEAAMRAGMSLARQLGEEIAAQATAPTVSTGPIPTATPRRVI